MPQRGFSLLEMLVVFVLVSLIATLLIQGLTHVLHLRERFLDHQSQAREGVLREFWFRSTLSSLLPEPDQGTERRGFVGERRGLIGTTLAPLNADGGVPERIRWEIVPESGYSVLRYRVDERLDWEVIRWSGLEGGFRYQDDKGAWHNQWPPALGGPHPQLPRVIELSSGGKTPALYWAVAVTGQRNPSTYLLPFEI